MSMPDEQTPAPQLVGTGARWRVAFATGFLDGDSARRPAQTGLSYMIGWKAGKAFRLRRERVI